MAKKNIDYPEQINFLARLGTLEKVIAIAYYRGEGGKYAGVVRDLVSQGITRWLESLTPVERKRFDSILKNVQEAAATRQAIKSHTLRSQD